MTTYNTDTSDDSNLIPSTSIGKFDASYNDANGQFEITINFKIDYPNNPNGTNWAGDNEKHAFRDAFFQLAKTAWEGKFRFRGSGAHAGQIATPEFTLSEVTDGSEHLDVEMMAGESGGSGIYGGTLLKLSELDNNTHESRNPAATHTGVAGGEANLLNEYSGLQDAFLGAVGSLTLNRVRNPNNTWQAWTLDGTSQTKLNTFATAANAFKAVEPRFPLTITISTGLSQKYQDVKTVIENHLAGQNCTYPVNIVRNDHGKTGRTKHKTSITVASSRKTGIGDFVDYWKTSGWLHTYKISPHEFGHCIGLPDEYLHYTSMPRIAGAHDAWETLCQGANVPHNPHIKFNYSIMSYGTLFAPCHAVTLWKRLEDITTAGSWAIEMVDAASTRQF